ncbi:diguanylate cyclase (GGDEF) domain-containing protein [Paraburkholderia steynii]|uniref:diguanylate cyclase n=1 Tax=Paraburkholderia steynii TaxID=1245441 RepID=A0A7Z7BBH3_9BURK|nr:diguanylate cyclase [Paraburkholderia steynii]SDI57110.1 diguanylate cyclase (GGDEF) domain-containing protein [Paraburkholderia steynii]
MNEFTIQETIRRQLLISTAQTLQRESLPFDEIRHLQSNFLEEFKAIYADPAERKALLHNFSQIFYRHTDGSYTQRAGLFEGNALSDGRRFGGMSATYAPDIPPDEDIKIRLTLAYILSYKYGSSVKGRFFNFYGVLPEKGFPIFQASDIAKVFTYSGPDALKLETYEFYYRGFDKSNEGTVFTRMYWDPSNSAWMTTIATPDVADESGRHRIMACVDVLLDDLMRRTAKPPIEGAYTTVFQADSEGTLIYHRGLTTAIKSSGGKASIRSLKLAQDYAVLTAGLAAKPGQVSLVTTADEIVAVGAIPRTPWLLSVHYPKALMRPAIAQNLAILITLGIVTLLVEIFILRSILQKQVATPLFRLIHAARQIGLSKVRLDKDSLPMRSNDEVGELAHEFATMAERVRDAHEQLEIKVQERTAALEEANSKLLSMSMTDAATGIANRRRFDQVLASEWQRAQRTGSSLALAMIDVDWFKHYNDRYGHQAGDECLRSVARILAVQVARVTDLVARYGGEEFAVIAPVTGRDGALPLAQRLCAALESAALPHETSPFGHLTVSVGVAVAAPAEGGAPEDLMTRADTALYRAKAQGRNQAVLADAWESMT